MNETVLKSATSPATDKLALAQAAFQEFHSRCFWFMRDDLQVTDELLPEVVRGLRAHGNRRAFWIAAELCR